MDVFEKILYLKRLFYHQYGIHSNVVYVGCKERAEILTSAKSIECFQMPNKDDEKMFGEDMIEVNKENYLKVGYVLGNDEGMGG